MRGTLRPLRALVIAAPLALAAPACGGSDNPDTPTLAADAAADHADGKAGSAGTGGGDASEPETIADSGSDDAAEEQDAGEQDGSSGDADVTDPDATPDAPEEDAAGPGQVRIVAANLTSDNGQSYDPGHGVRILQGIHPDVVLMQEFKYGDNTPTAIRSFVDTTFDPTFAYFRETNAIIPNGVISRYPIADGGTWVDPEVIDRGFAWARIDLPGPKDLWAVSVHLLNTGTAGERNNEATAVLGYINAKVPSLDAFVVIGGDLNTPTRTESCFTTLGARFVTTGPWPVDQANNSNTNAKRQLPYDWVIASTALDPMEIPVAIGASSFPSGLVVDTRVYTPITDLSPALQTDSAASNMQHMAVVRDFLIP
jgi:endonuclease/exonuclease/phosphatase family metal-dependent hydrolase